MPRIRCRAKARRARAIGGIRSGCGSRYTSTSRPLTVLEMLVHVTRETVPPDILLIAINVPDDLISGIEADSEALE